MGNAKIRKLSKADSKWTDKSVKRHKHVFTEKVLIHLHGNPNKHINHWYYTADKCRFCDSFINAKYIENKPNLPIISFTKPHFAIGFTDIVKDEDND